MKKWIIWMYTGLVILVSAAGCSKGEVIPDDDPNSGPHINNPTDTVPPVIEINTPTLNQVYTSGNIINVTGKVSDGEGLYRGSIRITNDANDALVKEQLYEIHGLLQYNFNISHTASVTAVTDYTVTVSFEDHGQNITSRSVKVKVNP